MRYVCILVYEYITLYTREFLNSRTLARGLLENKIFCIVFIESLLASSYPVDVKYFLKTFDISWHSHTNKHTSGFMCV